MRVARWGDSLAVRLPKAVVDELGLAPGDDVEIITARRDRLVLDKADRRQAAVDAMATEHLVRPEGYVFDREEANAR
ncbi:AbrB/MazE/SpoVT family DNA-binding domain-containing protein [Salinarimonas sp.]|uniref:AbrB/MazE/SpoVT family DNA-binding domain-containing protein n=1 Tax=Salinarimonas sp. TaxID=2766526 RepID=UPI0032D99924